MDDAATPMTAAELLCPQCGTPYEPDDFLCSSCELLLNMEAAAGDYRPQDPSIVRALMAPPQRSSGAKMMPPSLGRPPPRRADPEMTVRGTVVMDEYTVPRMVAGLEVALSPLHPFEAHVASFVDGTNSVPQIAQAAEITKVEAAAVFQSLAERRIVELHRNEPPRRPPPAPAALAPAPAAPPAPVRKEKEITGSRTAVPPRAAPSAPPGAPPAGRSSAPRPKMTELQERQAPQQPKAESVLERAISLERRGEVEGAINVLKRAIGQVSHPAALCNKLALILVNQRKDYKQAEELLNKALRLEPDNAVYQQNLYKVIGIAAQKRDAGSKPPGSGGGGFLSKLLKK